ncbi:hypothetical protein BC629DRAFT_1547693 [Irpex lacteus]|nr:hypothetical protein BC629DRAFT_1547693 [Irpex lacteus]
MPHSELLKLFFVPSPVDKCLANLTFTQPKPTSKRRKSLAANVQCTQNTYIRMGGRRSPHQNHLRRTTLRDASFSEFFPEEPGNHIVLLQVRFRSFKLQAY